MTTTHCFSKIFNCLTTPRGIAFVSFSVALVSLIFALAAEHFWGVKPCVLCTYQRYIMLGLIGASVIGFFAQARAFSWVYALILLAGFSIAGYHIGVEQHWWKGPDACSATAPVVDAKASQADQIKAFREKMKNQSTTIVRCDEVNWRIFGVSATIWTFVLYLGMLGFLSVGCVCRKYCRNI
ncbi:MAG: disulfide bond formation protein B [Pseudomonadota bacterium]|jgi:disulfide bond formation protein DsbB|nr:disulfide bond formation protein B [Alphaproteobacteria bacterium]MDP5370029.1 disulfide bond formation protein B [Pseudomonadota bacterium]